MIFYNIFIKGHFINSAEQSLTLEIFQAFGSCATCKSYLIFSGYEKLQADTSLIPPGKKKLIEGTGKKIQSCFFVGSIFVNIKISGDVDIVLFHLLCEH